MENSKGTPTKKTGSNDKISSKEQTEKNLYEYDKKPTTTTPSIPEEMPARDNYHE